MNLSKKITIISLFIFLIPFSGNTQKINPPYNIKDYFLLLPDSLLKNSETTVSIHQRELALKFKTEEELWNHNGFWQIDTIDYRNGYMKFSSTGDGSGTEFEITYFIKKDKTREIAVNTIYWDLAVISSSLKFYSFEKNIWKDITIKVLPEIKLSLFTNEQFAELLKKQSPVYPVFFKLPQKGKTIKAKIDVAIIDYLLDNNIINEDEYSKIKQSLKQILLVWDNETFHIQK